MRNSSSFLACYAVLVFVAAPAMSSRRNPAVLTGAVDRRLLCRLQAYIGLGLCSDSSLNTVSVTAANSHVEPTTSGNYSSDNSPGRHFSAPSATCGHGEGHRGCGVVDKRAVVVREGCTPLNVTFTHCRGRCCSETKLKAVSADVPVPVRGDFYDTGKSCCAPTKTISRAQQLSCLGGNRTVYLIDTSECSCAISSGRNFNAQSTTCRHAEGHWRCGVVEKRDVVAREGCTPLDVTFKHCRGRRCSETKLKAVVAEAPLAPHSIEDFYNTGMSCCAHTKTVSRAMQLSCLGGNRTVYLIESTECSCTDPSTLLSPLTN